MSAPRALPHSLTHTYKQYHARPAGGPRLRSCWSSPGTGAGEANTTHGTLNATMKCLLPSLLNKLKGGSRDHSELVKDVTGAAATDSLHDVFAAINGRQPATGLPFPPSFLPSFLPVFLLPWLSSTTILQRKSINLVYMYQILPYNLIRRHHLASAAQITGNTKGGRREGESLTHRSHLAGRKRKRIIRDQNWK